MRTTRWLAVSLAALLAGAALAPAARADSPVRIHVSLGDVFYDAGRPYYRHDRSPVYVVYDAYRRPSYYRYAPARHYAAPARYYTPVRYYAPPPRYYARPVAYRPIYQDYRWEKHDKHDKHGRGNGKGHGRGHDD